MRWMLSLQNSLLEFQQLELVELISTTPLELGLQGVPYERSAA